MSRGLTRGQTQSSPRTASRGGSCGFNESSSFSARPRLKPVFHPLIASSHFNRRKQAGFLQHSNADSQIKLFTLQYFSLCNIRYLRQIWTGLAGSDSMVTIAELDGIKFL